VSCTILNHGESWQQASWYLLFCPPPNSMTCSTNRKPANQILQFCLLYSETPSEKTPSSKAQSRFYITSELPLPRGVRRISVKLSRRCTLSVTTRLGSPSSAWPAGPEEAKPRP
jgi:hypothetical protein